MSPAPKHLIHFEGGSALSAFRAAALLPRLQAIEPRITGLAARHVHWVWSDHPVAAVEADRHNPILIRRKEKAHVIVEADRIDALCLDHLLWRSDQALETALGRVRQEVVGILGTHQPLAGKSEGEAAGGATPPAKPSAAN